MKMLESEDVYDLIQSILIVDLEHAIVQHTDKHARDTNLLKRLLSVCFSNLFCFKSNPRNKYIMLIASVNVYLSRNYPVWNVTASGGGMGQVACQMDSNVRLKFACSFAPHQIYKRLSNHRQNSVEAPFQYK